MKDKIEIYHAATERLISEEGALRHLRYLKPNNQICILNQDILDRHLMFNEAINIS